MRRTGWRYYVNPRGSSSSMPDYLEAYTARTAAAAARLAMVSLECKPAAELIAQYGQHADNLIYADPPYLGSVRNPRAGRAGHGREYSAEMLTEDQHRELADALLEARSAVVLSGYDSPLYRELYGGRLAVVFGDLMLAPPQGNKQTLIYRKPPNAGARGATGGFRRDVEGIYLLGPWPTGLGGLSSVITTNAPSQGNPSSPQGRYGHPHAKPVDVMETLVAACPSGTIADPFAGSGSTLVAARNLCRRVIGVEVEERYCERAALRLSQMILEAS